MDITNMQKDELLALKVEDVDRHLTPEDVLHMAKVFGAFWSYDYESARQGKVGMHAILKSGLHSDGFFVSRILLAPENIRRIIAAQMVMRIREALCKTTMPTCVAGVPDGATKLGEDIGEMLDIRVLQMDKIDGRISLISSVYREDHVLVVEDFCTRGTGFAEAVSVIKINQPDVRFIPIDPVIINRGGLVIIDVDGVGLFGVRPVVEWRVNDWDPKVSCPLCDLGSVPIKPKATEENWQAITTSQQ